MPHDGRLPCGAVLQPRDSAVRGVLVSRGLRVWDRGLLPRRVLHRGGVLQRCTMRRRAVLHRRDMRPVLRDERRLHRWAVLRRINEAVRAVRLPQ